jgi:hypothetical protein
MLYDSPEDADAYREELAEGHWVPSQDEIERRAAEIRNGWTPSERARRRVQAVCRPQLFERYVTLRRVNHHRMES